MAENVFDPRYEFDAPQYYDFTAITSSTGSLGSAWFAKQHAGRDEEVAPASSGRTPLKDANSGPAPLANSAGKRAREASKTPKKNIVTSWGPEVKKKVRADGGRAEAAPSRASAKASAAVPQSEHEAATHAQPVAAKKASMASRQRAQRASVDSRAKPAKKDVLGVKVSLMKPKSIKVVKARLSKVLQPRRTGPARSTKQLTVPEDVELHTSKRAHVHTRPDCAAQKKQVEQGDGQHAGRHDDQDNSGSDVDASPYKPLVLKAKEFETKTPLRFKRQPVPLPPPKPLGITEPKEPTLRVLSRNRPSAFKPREQAEAEEMANMPIFRASTLNPLILKSSSGQLGVPKVDKRELTEPQPFHFISDDRAEGRAARQRQLAALQEQSEMEKERVERERQQQREQAKKARKSVAVPHVAPQVPVKPRSPMLLTKFRAREVKVDEPGHEFHARPVPKFLSVPSVDLRSIPHYEPPAPTQPEPFRLATEQRGEQYRATLAQRRAAEEEAARRARIPRATGLPLSTDMPLVPPRPEPRSLTVPEPFGLASEARHEEYAERRRRELEAEEAAKRAEAEFKARPMWRGIPYRIHESNLPLTVPEGVQLATSSRAVEREQFDKAVEDKLREAELAAQLAAQEARAREEEERRQLRKVAMFRARPMPDLTAPPATKPPPAKPLTRPQSPKLGRSKKRRGGVGSEEGA